MINRERESVEEILGGQVELPPSGGEGGEVRQGAKGKHLTDTILAFTGNNCSDDNKRNYEK